MRQIDPDYILAEIPPDRWPTARRIITSAMAESKKNESSRFPEYVDVIIPLQREMDFEIIPCAAWTQEMADDRRQKLSEWEQSRPRRSSGNAKGHGLDRPRAVAGGTCCRSA